MTPSACESGMTESLLKFFGNFLRQTARGGNSEPDGIEFRVGSVAREHRIMKRRRVKHGALPAIDGVQKHARQKMARQHDGRSVREIKHDRDEKMMRHRQAPHHRVARADFQNFIRGGDAVANGFVRKRHAFARAGRAGSETNESEI